MNGAVPSSALAQAGVSSPAVAPAKPPKIRVDDVDVRYSRLTSEGAGHVKRKVLASHADRRLPQAENFFLKRAIFGRLAAACFPPYARFASAFKERRNRVAQRSVKTSDYFSRDTPGGGSNLYGLSLRDRRPPDAHLFAKFRKLFSWRCLSIFRREIRGGGS